MTSETLRKAVEQNHENLKEVLDAVDASYEMDDDPEKDAEHAAFFGADKDAVGVELTEDERVAWMFEQNVEAVEALAEEVGVAERSISDVATSDEKYAGMFVPTSEEKRAEQKRAARDGDY